MNFTISDEQWSFNFSYFDCLPLPVFGTLKNFLRENDKGKIKIHLNQIVKYVFIYKKTFEITLDLTFE